MQLTYDLVTFFALYGALRRVNGVYAAGDASYGASLIVHAIQQGRQAAKAIDENLTLEEK